METLLDAAIEAAQPVLGRHAVTVERKQESDLLPVEVDPLLFTQVLVNLLVNAAEAMAPAGGRVELTRAADPGARARRDRDPRRRPGARDPGRAPGELFKPFFTTKPEGHGLGLAVSQNIVLEHGGRIVAANRPPQEGTGASFEVQLPVMR